MGEEIKPLTLQQINRAVLKIGDVELHSMDKPIEHLCSCAKWLLTQPEIQKYLQVYAKDKILNGGKFYD